MEAVVKYCALDLIEKAAAAGQSIDWSSVSFECARTLIPEAIEQIAKHKETIAAKTVELAAGASMSAWQWVAIGILFISVVFLGILSFNQSRAITHVKNNYQSLKDRFPGRVETEEVTGQWYLFFFYKKTVTKHRISAV
ncbi:hypothetical protein B9Z55_018999 [Caenorhabditis nigoni]|uniref:Uncharacterized protein n=1 Tax=Caenorhabditis nigoni TaxID=1611254 RepID=A0A2G5TGM4_9PELO|nr:hypothetical protein B9Z55_018999 [Caenorhabditis nigoni]